MTGCFYPRVRLLILLITLYLISASGSVHAEWPGEIDIALRKLVGVKYGQGRGHFDCVTLVRYHLRKHFHLLLGDSERERTAVDGDKIAARFLDPVARFQFDATQQALIPLFGSFGELQIGDVVGIGEPFRGGENGESHWHMGVISSVDEETGDFSMIHAAGYYDLRGNPHGRVAEESVVAYLKRIHGRGNPSWKKKRYTHAFIHRPKTDLATIIP